MTDTVSPAPPPAAGQAPALGQGDAVLLRYDNAPTRRAHIVALVRQRGFCSTTELVAELGVSDMTVRRDVRRLEADGELRPVRGGVSVRHATLRTSEFTTRAGLHAEAKQRMAAAAAALVRSDDVVAFDAGTSAFAVATCLPQDYRGHVVTHSIPVLQHLLHIPAARVTGLGGDLHHPSQAFVGPSTIEAIARLRVRVLFLGVAGIDADGLYAEAEVECEVKKALIASAERVVVLADAGKFARPAAVRFSGLDLADVLITDAQPRRVVRAALKASTTDLVVVDPPLA